MGFPARKVLSEMTGLSPFPPLLDRHRNLPDPQSQKSCLRSIFDSSKIRLLALKYLRNVKSVFYIFGLDAFHWISHNVGGITTPVARTACEACAESLLRIRATNSIYVFQGWKINFAELPDGIHK